TATGAYVDRAASAPYTARLGEAAHRIVPGPPRVTALVAARILSGEGGTSATPAWIVIGDARIVATGSGPAPGGATDLGDALLAPGYVDIQINGAGAVDFATASAEAIIATIDALIDGGCTACLPTICSAPLDRYAAMLERLAVVRAARPESVLGVHLEGPFLGGAPGAHPPEFVRDVDLDWLVALCDRFGDLVRLVTLAPEADPGLAAVAALRARGITVALGHSTVDLDGARAAADAGAGIVTHLFNGMGPLHHRAPGLAGAALDDRRLVPSVIADGVHVHPLMLRLALRARPDAVLVTDAVATAPPLELRSGAAYLPDGTLAGSTLTMASAVRHVAALGISAAATVRCATGNPARAIGATQYGRIAAGCRADLVALDPVTLEVRAVWLGGVRR
ncbi:MAG: N-acetylgalactosamine-6-phosphate deacetylase, partial [Actinomycetota bacterium]|nr:N-acetylgalactosamine-6-phosphate deacetylase [Actinomycetota bacterium]